MEAEKDNPGVYVPPPLLYVLTFLVAVFIQKKVSINDVLFHHQWIKIIGVVLLIIASFFLVSSLRQFFNSKNTVITMKSATSLQTTGIYNFTRNPMYVGLAIVYLSVSCFIGNWWNIILFPFLLLLVQVYIIKREESYLTRKFGQEYLAYKAKVRRWL
ncbi:isoprenylcysteine carboxylmethyltransferase family protein [Fibrella sp. HMF5335]|uniref:Isoprenylcysteine carboxylmethyltransferase family protein n=1 Tax=Fibrella rubiginis TaxID=2817060 RepID=A0A939K1W4_9BACT|nr:isoprenylcysteine carboxylmethyltransferase family protein [Fibrella rubiginis]MBO0935679.1 isoprenylcysteine carboxylmethyltransferase family protein [Fibrella rubiginis]